MIRKIAHSTKSWIFASGLGYKLEGLQNVNLFICGRFSLFTGSGSPIQTATNGVGGILIGLFWILYVVFGSVALIRGGSINHILDESTQ